jgi:hypothetical protein
MGESIPNYLPGHLLSRHFGILPMYLPRDRFLSSECSTFGPRSISLGLSVGKEMPISRIVIAVPNATVVLLD